MLLWRWLPSTRSRARENSGGRSAWYRDPRNHRHPYPSIVDVGKQCAAAWTPCRRTVVIKRWCRVIRRNQADHQAVAPQSEAFIRTGTRHPAACSPNLGSRLHFAGAALHLRTNVCARSMQMATPNGSRTSTGQSSMSRRRAVVLVLIANIIRLAFKFTSIEPPDVAVGLR